MLCAAFVLCLTVAVGFVARVHAQAATRVSGQISNGTANASAATVSNLPIALFQITAAGMLTRTAQTDATGRFVFDKVDADAQAFFLRADYAGIRYFGDPVSAAIAATTPLTLTVYEQQALPANFEIDRAHFIFDAAPRQLNGVALLQVTNSTDRVFLLPLPLPDKSGNVSFDDPLDEARAVRSADGSLSFPILPTTTEVFYGMTLRTQPPDHTLVLPLRVGIGRLNVLVSQVGDVRAASPQLARGEPFTTQSGAAYLQLAGSNLRAGTAVNVALSNLPGADTAGNTRNVILAVGGVGALALLFFPFLRKRRAEEAADVAATGERLARLQAIAALDDEFEAGELDQDEYRAERAALKAELLSK